MDLRRDSSMDFPVFCCCCFCFCLFVCLLLSLQHCTVDRRKKWEYV